jgi:hypothetical protein
MHVGTKHFYRNFFRTEIFLICSQQITNYFIIYGSEDIKFILKHSQTIQRVVAGKLRTAGTKNELNSPMIKVNYKFPVVLNIFGIVIKDINSSLLMEQSTLEFTGSETNSKPLLQTECFIPRH